MATDDEPQRSRIPNLLAYEQRADTRTTRHERAGSHIGTPQVRPNIVKRVDCGAEIVCAKLAVAQMTRGEWECWIAMKEGILFDPLPKRSRRMVTRTWHVVKPPATSATADEIARHYGYTVGSVIRMERQARHILNDIRTRAGLTAEVRAVPIWPAVMSDANLLRYLYG